MTGLPPTPNKGKRQRHFKQILHVLVRYCNPPHTTSFECRYYFQRFCGSDLLPNQLFNPFLPSRLTGKGFRFYPGPTRMGLLKVIMLKARIHPVTAAVGRRIIEIAYFLWNRVTIIGFRELLLLNEQIPFFSPHG